MTNDERIFQWLHNTFLKQWNHMLTINRNYSPQKQIPYVDRKIFFPLIPLEADGYSVRNFLAFVLKYLVKLDSNSFLILLCNTHHELLWAAFQKTQSYAFTELIELNEQLDELNACLTIENRGERFNCVQSLLKKYHISQDLGFYLLLNIEVVSEFKEIYENFSSLLDFYSQIWDLMARHFKSHTLQFYPEPLFFKFFRHLTTKNFIFNASEFKKLLGNLLPTQNLILLFLERDFFAGLAIMTRQNDLHLQFLNHDTLQNHLLKYEKNQEKGLEYLNKIVKATTPLTIKNQRIQATASITLTEDIWLMIQDIMTQYRFEYTLDRFFEMLRETEEKWTIERKIILFRRWGKSFMSFQIHKLIPTQISSIIASILRFQNETITRTVWLVVNDSLELIYILGLEFQMGLFTRIYMISNPTIVELFNSESDKALGVKKVHSYFAENKTWVNQLIVINSQDLNLLISFSPLLTTIKGSLKYLNLIENIITYHMYFYPPNFFADLIGRKGATYFFKNILFPMSLSKTDSNNP